MFRRQLLGMLAGGITAVTAGSLQDHSHIEDYDVRWMDVRVYANSEAEDYRGRFHIKDKWAVARLNEELSAEEYVATVMDTTVPTD